MACANIGADIDYMLGHKRSDGSNLYFDEKNPQTFERIATRVKTINFSQKFKTNNCSLEKLDGTTGKQLPQNPNTKLVNGIEQTMKVKIFLHSKEPGDSIKILVSGKVLKLEKVSHNRLTRPHTTLVGHIEEGD